MISLQQKLIVIKLYTSIHTTNETILIDVKVLSHHRGGQTRSKILNDKQIRMGVRILYVDIENFECRWKNKLDDYDAKRNELGQFIKLPKFKI